MIHLITLALFLVLVVHDMFLAYDPPPFPLVTGLSTTSTILIGVAPFVALWGVVQLVLVRAGRSLDRTGRPPALRLALLTLTGARVGVLLVFAATVLAFAWLDEVRALLGDLVLLDEALALLPPIATLTLFWWSYYPIERRLREAAVLSLLDSDRPIPGLPTRTQYVVDQVRLHLLLVLVPLFTLTLWWESLDRALGWLERHDALPPPTPWFTGALTFVHYAGVLAILALMPVLLVRVWATIRLAHGPLRERLERLCRANRVRVRDILVWRTHNAMVNGALIGVVPPFRYILLTDALLASMPLRQVEAVMAHEVAHARRHHLPWLLVLLVATAGLTWAAASFAWETLLPPPEPDADPLLPTGILSGVTLLVTVLVFGHVSRRFEQQADAFAVQHLSRENNASDDHPPRITDEAAHAMAGALASVAALNHIDPEMFSFRHGSIGVRRRRLLTLVGAPVDDLPIDRRVRRLKLIGLAALALLIALSTIQSLVQ